MSDTTSPPTLDEIGLSGDVAAILEEAEKTARGVMTEPTERWQKKSNLITHNGEALPERVKVWRTMNGHEAWLATAMIWHHMKKRHANGQPVFSRTPISSKAIPIDQSCDICILRDIKKTFYTMYDYEGHMSTYHQREWESKQREEDRRERKEERELLRQLVSGAAKKEVPQAVKDRMAKARAAKGKSNGGSSRASVSADASDERVDAGSA